MLPPKLSPQLALDLGLDDSASFTSYYPGPNAEALAAVRACALGTGESNLFLYGDKGLGKTHLLQAACRAAAGEGALAVYLPLADALTWSLQVLEGLETMSLVAVDDVHLLRQHQDWQVALFHLFNSVRDAGGRLLFAAQDKPGDLGFSLPDLVSRLQWGLVLRLQDLDDEEKLAGLCFRAHQRGLELPRETAQYLLARFPRDMAYLFDTLDRLDQASLAAQRRLTIPFIRQVLQLS
ncbi:DnaA regulatory inactivator Hda [Alkalilimnicola ehrlichii]|uniref:DnaA regulatory inactivator Hda n=1 Tax=Alkalilimnicola ehrlichii TaxID=351052 RepID=A0A3E0X1E7_9GAMM|nr:DnaA regulatory inactivator Hda [Alkalilimnicola ehrlichii]RFA30435.1 DnaA regulatory inactivator Hda [Alkalilimnicola ehrlichii]RFA37987.1 DnaA regulatory inactivator Hda [Alkalilimnicola ehrlichii]